MHTSTATPDCIKPLAYQPSTNLLKPLPQTEIVQKQPSSFAVALVHEVRNPLTNISLSLGILESLIKDPEAKKYLDIIKRSSLRINELATGLLTQQQVYEVPPETYSMHHLLDEVIEMAEDRIKLKSIEVWKDYEPQDCTIVLDKEKIKIGLTNIIVNAVDAMGNKGRLKIATRSIDGKFVVMIEDNGCGISKENLTNIFKPYFTNKPGGLGLGLAATYEMLKSNRVGIKVESEEGLGTRFLLFFEIILLISPKLKSGLPAIMQTQ